MGELTKLMAAVCEFIDIVGSYKLSPEARKRADAKRQEVRHEFRKQIALSSARLPLVKSCMLPLGATEACRHQAAGAAAHFV